MTATLTGQPETALMDLQGLGCYNGEAERKRADWSENSANRLTWTLDETRGKSRERCDYSQQKTIYFTCSVGKADSKLHFVNLLIIFKYLKD